MRIAVANDHRGVKAKEQITALVAQLGHDVIDFGTDGDTPADYADMAYVACTAIIDGKADRAILICGAGTCMAIAANKVKGVRAALAYDEIEAQISREHLDSNVLCLSGDMLGEAILMKIVVKWLAAEFKGGRYLRRLKKVAAIEEGLDPRTIT